MSNSSCFPELPGGQCWPRDGGAPYRGCFPGPEPRRLRDHGAPGDEDALASLVRVFTGGKGKRRQTTSRKQRGRHA